MQSFLRKRLVYQKIAVYLHHRITNDTENAKDKRLHLFRHNGESKIPK